MKMIMSAKHFCKLLKRICRGDYGRTIYYSGLDWGDWNRATARWQFDCLLLIKAILWGWNHRKNKDHGGAVYCSNGVPDMTELTMINLCKPCKFRKMKPGCLLYMSGHVGIYVGRITINGKVGNVIESTADGNYCVQLTKVTKSGKRFVNGVQMRSWERSGFLPYINYGKNYKRKF